MSAEQKFLKLCRDIKSGRLKFGYPGSIRVIGPDSIPKNNGVTANLVFIEEAGEMTPTE